MYKLLITLVAVLLQPSASLYRATLVGETTVNGRFEFQKSSTEFPYVVELLLFQNHLCGGTLLNRGVVVTAGHCFESTNTKGLQVKAGHLFRESKNAPGLQTVDVHHFAKHPKYFGKVINGQNENYFDIAVVKLKKLFILTEFVNVANLAPYGTEEPFKDEVVTALGWGTTEDGYLSASLRKLDFKVLSPEQCSVAVGAADYIKSLLCVRGIKNKGAFNGGDSGGPLVKHFPENPKKDLLLGVISFNYRQRASKWDDKTVPIETKPSISSNIPVFHKWVQKTVDFYTEKLRKEFPKEKI